MSLLYHVVMQVKVAGRGSRARRKLLIVQSQLLLDNLTISVFKRCSSAAVNVTSKC